jgi:hypothetical protein
MFFYIPLKEKKIRVRIPPGRRVFYDTTLLLSTYDDVVCTVFVCCEKWVRNKECFQIILSRPPPRYVLETPRGLAGKQCASNVHREIASRIRSRTQSDRYIKVNCVSHDNVVSHDKTHRKCSQSYFFCRVVRHLQGGEKVCLHKR